MDAVGHTFDCHVINQINTFHCTLVLILTLVVESGHGIVEMRYMGVSGIERGHHISVFGTSVGNTGQNALAGTILSKLQGAGEFGSRVPACYT